KPTSPLSSRKVLGSQRNFILARHPFLAWATRKRSHLMISLNTRSKRACVSNAPTTHDRVVRHERSERVHIVFLIWVRTQDQPLRTICARRNTSRFARPASGVARRLRYRDDLHIGSGDRIGSITRCLATSQAITIGK